MPRRFLYVTVVLRAGMFDLLFLSFFNSHSIPGSSQNMKYLLALQTQNKIKKNTTVTVTARAGT